jgi:hypothetical protein
METILNDEPANDILPEPARPQFLTILCILTWVCAGFMLIMSLLGIINKPSPEEQAEQIEKVRAMSPEAADKMEAAFEAQSDSGQILNTLLGILAIAVSSIGAMMMWQLKKRGFQIYLIGELIPYFGLLFAGTESFGTMASMIGMSASAVLGIAVGIMLLFDGIFIAMYASNLKYMKS